MPTMLKQSIQPVAVKESPIWTHHMSKLLVVQELIQKIGVGK
jgi:hypothetical protein